MIHGDRAGNALCQAADVALKSINRLSGLRQTASFALGRAQAGDRIDTGHLVGLDGDDRAGFQGRAGRPDISRLAAGRKTGLSVVAVGEADLRARVDVLQHGKGKRVSGIGVHCQKHKLTFRQTGALYRRHLGRKVQGRGTAQAAKGIASRIHQGIRGNLQGVALTRLQRRRGFQHHPVVVVPNGRITGGKRGHHGITRLEHQVARARTHRLIEDQFNIGLGRHASQVVRRQGSNEHRARHIGGRRAAQLHHVAREVLLTDRQVFGLLGLPRKDHRTVVLQQMHLRPGRKVCGNFHDGLEGGAFGQQGIQLHRLLHQTGGEAIGVHTAVPDIQLEIIGHIGGGSATGSGQHQVLTLRIFVDAANGSATQVQRNGRSKGGHGRAR